MFSLFSWCGERLSRIFFRLRFSTVFKMIGRGVYCVPPFRVDGAKWIEVGEKTFFQRGSWLYCEGVEGVTPSLRIGKNCTFGYNNYISCVRHVSIGDFVLTANNIYISDNYHQYKDISRPIIQQPVGFKKAVSIGDGCWIGENVSILGVSIGKNCVIGANAVVTHDIPDYSVAVGIPAKVIRQFDIKHQKWISI